MVREIQGETMEDLLNKKGVKPMIHGGKTMKAFLMVEPRGHVGDRDLDFGLKGVWNLIRGRSRKSDSGFTGLWMLVPMPVKLV